MGRGQHRTAQPAALASGGSVEPSVRGLAQDRADTVPRWGSTQKRPLWGVVGPWWRCPRASLGPTGLSLPDPGVWSADTKFPGHRVSCAQLLITEKASPKTLCHHQGKEP